jgi:membrane-bound lytic murein transglycosylase A
MTVRRSAIVVLAIAGLAVAGLTSCEFTPPPDRLRLTAAEFTDLQRWDADDHAAALATFVKGCDRTVARAANKPFISDGLRVDAGHWRVACDAAAAVPAGDRDAAKAFFEQAFRPYAVTNNDDPEGLFTGYYEAELDGARRPGGRYSVPLYRRPNDLVTVDLGQFRADLKGQRIAGRVVDGRLKPYAARAAIDKGALDGKGLEILWVDDPVDAFFLHIQGSGRVRLADGTIVRVGYDGHNGHPYYAIGRELVARGVMPVEQVSMQSIRQWLAGHPADAESVMARNASYIFFRELDGDGPIGALGVALTPERSLAVDTTYLPLGAPVWLDTTEPSGAAVRRLMVSQDTGGAIRGPVRGDVFWGFGQAAAATAGAMKQPGRYWLLLPSTTAPAS